MSEITQIATQLTLPPHSVEATIRLLDQGNTVPFIARYRKEVMGGLSDEHVQAIATQLKKVRALDERRESIRRALTERGKLSEGLATALDAAQTAVELEDLYAPYKQKRQTRASVAREKGLAPLAVLILKQVTDGYMPNTAAIQYISADVATSAEVLQGARDIVAEMLSDHPRVRQSLRRRLREVGRIICQKIEEADDPKEVYQLYYQFTYPLDQLKPHQILAINRGEREKVLKVHLELPEHETMLALRQLSRPDRRSPWHDELVKATDDGFKRLLWPSVERELRKELTQWAEEHAIGLFAKNLRDLLSQRPLIGRTILAIDPGFRTGCKVAVVDPTGKVLDTATIYAHHSAEQKDDALKRLMLLIHRHHVDLIAIGNGTAGRETELLVAELTRSLPDLRYLMVNEAGASVYSASELARQELPDLDVSLRGAVSIGRRTQDPLAELVKIEPKAIGVGMYQHDVDQKELAETLDGVVQLVVNQVGVDLNTASPALLTYVAGIGPSLAQKLVAHRNEHGPFLNRARLQKVSGLGPKSYEQCAGFLRIRQGENPLDATAIHPESYPLAHKIMQEAKITLDMSAEQLANALATLPSAEQLAQQLGAGQPTIQDILEQLARPGRDPREQLAPPLLRNDTLSLQDLQVGQCLEGTVRNIIDFGIFIDIGVKRDGLLHRTAIPKNIELAVGQIIPVTIKEVDHKRERISLDWPQNT